MESLIEEEFPQLKGVTYLDHAGTTLYSQSQMRSYFSDLSSHLYGNPHSNNTSSKLSTETIDHAREMILNHFNTDSDQYDVIFTSNCTSALSLLSDMFPWQPPSCTNNDTEHEVTYINSKNHSNSSLSPSLSPSQSIFCYLEDNHTSVLGMRETAALKGAKLVCITQDTIVPYDKNNKSSFSPSPSLSPSTSSVYHLFAYPAQSNFSGFKYPLDWCTSLPNKDITVNGLPEGSNIKWLVLLDIASFSSTNPLDLRKYPAHFLTLSFYKLFGFPTGLGALLVRQDIGHLLKREYFGGGTVLMSTARMRSHVPRPLPHEKFEDGTVSFLDIAALKYGYMSLKLIYPSMEAISEHVFQLGQLTYKEMTSLEHYNGHPLCLLYNKGDFTDRNRQGGIIVFNLLRSDGTYIGYSEVDKMASVNDIHLRTGCFCNPGACQIALGLTCDEIIQNMKAGHTCGNNIDLINGKPTGCVRISFGYMNTIRDVNNFIDFLTNSFIDTSPDHTPNGPHPPLINDLIITRCVSIVGDLTVGSDVTVINHQGGKESYALDRLIVYPVKSCSGYQVTQWSVGDKGLLWDREWMIINDRGASLTQKQEPKLALIKPIINDSTLTLTSTGYPSISVQYIHSYDGTDYCKTKVCGDKVSVIDRGDTVSEWLSAVLGRQCRLVQMDPTHKREANNTLTSGISLSLSNEAQYLVLNQSSVQYLHSKLTDHNLSVEGLVLRFRPNFVLKGKEDQPYVENNWKTVKIGKLEFNVSGQCSRCQMICVDQISGIRSNEPLQTLLKLTGSKANFGIYLTRK